MIFLHRFYKEDGTWYIDLESWQGDKSDLAMVLGADVLLEQLAGGKDSIQLFFANEHLEDSKQLIEDVDLELVDEVHRDIAFELGGAFYKTEDMKSVWLCDVTKFVFNGEMPKIIWYKKYEI